MVVRIMNKSAGAIKMFAVFDVGQWWEGMMLTPGQDTFQNANLNQLWRITEADSRCITMFKAISDATIIIE